MGPWVTRVRVLEFIILGNFPLFFPGRDIRPLSVKL